MVQLSPVPSYDEENDDAQAAADGGSDLMATAFSDFAGTVSATANQLSLAADVFAKVAGRLLDSASARVEMAVSSSASVADDAARSLDEAKALHASVDQTAETTREEVSRALDDMRAMRLSFDQVAEGARESLSNAVEEARTIRGSVAALAESARTDVASGLSEAQAARLALEETAEKLRSELKLSASEAASGPTLAETVEGARSELQRVTDDALGRISAEGGRWNEEIQATAGAAAVRASSSFEIGAQELIDRLEADYKLLRDLVSSLDARIASLTRDDVSATAASRAENPQAEPSVGVISDWHAESPDALHAVAQAVQGEATKTDPASAADSAASQPQHEAAWYGGARPEDESRVDKQDWPQAPYAPSEPAEIPIPHSPPAQAATGPEAQAQQEPNDPGSSMPAEASDKAVVERDPWAGFGYAASASATAADTHPQEVAETPPEPVQQGEHARPDPWVSVYGVAPTASERTAWGNNEETTATPTREANAWVGDEPQSSRKATEPAESAGNNVELEGRVTLTIDPVPDFDRLLTLDGALSRLAAVRNVTLADYTKDEVTFRVEVTEPVEAGRFADELSRSVGYALQATAASPGNLHLKFAAD
jgi:hypothetical protein